MSAQSQPGCAASPATESAEPSAALTPDGGLYPQFAEPLRRDLQFIDAALSFYGGGPAGQDVARAWLRILAALGPSAQDTSHAELGPGKHSK